MGMFVDEHLSCHESADSCILVSDVSPAAGRRRLYFMAASLTYIETLTLLVFYEDKKQKANIECRILNVKC